MIKHTMEYTTISTEKKGNIGILYLNRPEVLNALSETMRRELVHYLGHVAKDETVKTLILSGKGKAFSAGADLNMFKKAYEAFRKDGTVTEFGRTDLPMAFIDFPKPMIAAINGAAVGFGLTVSLTCDIRVAAEGAIFSCAFVRVGVTPECGSSYFLPRLIGYARSAELALTAKTIDAQEALRLGLVNQVVPENELMRVAAEIASQISALPTDAVKMTKHILRHGMQSTLEQVLPYEGLVFQQRTQTEEHYEAVCARLEAIKTK
ncbi:MAG: enoyl-CoA hydratase/isomerase family protein [Deltaproteobacteria bacterium]|nr:enoyl-CoA hydratase/isomerase family protein [Deltaproteobacteria bacterium]